MLSRPRVYLLIILAALVLAYGTQYFAVEQTRSRYSQIPNPADFTLQLWGTTDHEYVDGLVPELPIFDPETGFWLLEGNRIDDFAYLVQGLEIGPHGSSPFVVVRLPTDATADTYRRAIASLVEQGICQIGVFSPFPAEEYLPPNLADADWLREGFYAPIYRVLSVKPDYLATRPCIDRFPAYPSQ